MTDETELIAKLLLHVPDTWLLPCTNNCFHAAVRAITSQLIRFEAGQAIRRTLYLWSAGQEWTPSFMKSITDTQWNELCAKGLSVSQRQAILTLTLECEEASSISPAFFDRVKIKGIGPWTYNNIMISTGSRDDIFLEGDKYINYHLQRWGVSIATIKASTPRNSLSRLTRILWRLLKTSSAKLRTLEGVTSLVQSDFHPLHSNS
jgi:3-methyladenine DNA glycosylase/8-oxoguanine DNA glycosylase